MRIAAIFTFAALLLMIAYCTHEIKSACDEIMQRLNIIYGVINGDYRKLEKNDETIATALNESNRMYSNLMVKQLNILQGVADTLVNMSELLQDDDQDEQDGTQMEEENGEEN